MSTDYTIAKLHIDIKDAVTTAGEFDQQVGKKLAKSLKTAAREQLELNNLGKNAIVTVKQQVSATDTLTATFQRVNAAGSKLGATLRVIGVESKKLATSNDARKAINLENTVVQARLAAAQKILTSRRGEADATALAAERQYRAVATNATAEVQAAHAANDKILQATIQAGQKKYAAEVQLAASYKQIAAQRKADIASGAMDENLAEIKALAARKAARFKHNADIAQAERKLSSATVAIRQAASDKIRQIVEKQTQLELDIEQQNITRITNARKAGEQEILMSKRKAADAILATNAKVSAASNASTLKDRQVEVTAVLAIKLKKIQAAQDAYEAQMKYNFKIQAIERRLAEEIKAGAISGKVAVEKANADKKIATIAYNAARISSERKTESEVTAIRRESEAKMLRIIRQRSAAEAAAAAKHAASERRRRRDISLTGQEIKSTTQDVILSVRGIERVMAVLMIRRIFHAAIASIRQSVATLVDFQKAITEIQTIAQKNQATIDQWAGSVRKLSDAWDMTLVDAANARYQILSNQMAQGVANTEAFSDAAFKFARITRSTAEEAVNLLSARLNAYGNSAGMATKVSAELFKIIELGRVKAEEIADTLGRAAVPAAQLGISFSELGAMMALITNKGIKATESMTLIRSVIMKLAKPTTELQGLFAEWGVLTGEQAIQTYGLAGMMHKLEESTRGSASELAQLFGRIRSTMGITAIVADVDKFDDVLQEIEHGSMASYAEAQKRLFQSPAEQYSKELNKVKNYFVQDFAATIIANIVEISNTFGGLSNVLVKLTKGVGFLATVLGTMWAVQKVKYYQSQLAGVLKTKKSLAAIETVIAVRRAQSERNMLTSAGRTANVTAGALKRQQALLAKHASAVNALHSGMMAGAVAATVYGVSKIIASYTKLQNNIREIAHLHAMMLSKQTGKQELTISEFAASVKAYKAAAQDTLQTYSSIRGSIFTTISALDGMLESYDDIMKAGMKTVGSGWAGVASTYQDHYTALIDLEKDYQLQMKDLKDQERAIRQKAADFIFDMTQNASNNQQKLDNLEAERKAVEKAKDLSLSMVQNAKWLSSSRKNASEEYQRQLKREIALTKQQALLTQTMFLAKQKAASVDNGGVDTKTGKVDSGTQKYLDAYKQLTVESAEYTANERRKLATVKGDIQAAHLQLKASFEVLLGQINELYARVGKAQVSAVIGAKDDIQDKVLKAVLQHKSIQLDASAFQLAVTEMAQVYQDNKDLVGLRDNLETADTVMAGQQSQTMDNLSKMAEKVAKTEEAQAAATAAFTASTVELFKIVQQAMDAANSAETWAGVKLMTEFVASASGSNDPTRKDEFKEDFKVLNIFTDQIGSFLESLKLNKDGESGLSLVELRMKVEAIKAMTQSFGNLALDETQQQSVDLMVNRAEIALAQYANHLEAIERLGPLQEKLAEVKAESEKITVGLSKYAETINQMDNGTNDLLSIIHGGLPATLNGFTNEIQNAAESIRRIEALAIQHIEDKVSTSSQNKAQGGMIHASRGYHAKGVDTVPAMLTPGEFVINRNASKEFYSVLQSMNKSGNHVQPISNDYTQTIGDINVTVQGGDTSQQTVRNIASGLRREMARGTIGRM